MNIDKNKTPFLEKLARLAFEENNGNFENIIFVLPSQRAGLFLKRHLTLLAGKNIWAPQIFTINDFINSHVPIELADPLVLLFELYKVYQSTLGEDAESFEIFIKWGSIMISDFNEIDSNLTNQNIFTDLSNIKEIENYSLLSETLTDSQSKYILFWNSMIKIYKNFNEHLDELKIGYQGKIAKALALQPEKYLKIDSFDKIYFAGFNAISKAEQKIISYLVDSKKASVLWDSDEYYMNDEQAEAGFILRRIKSEFNTNFNWTDKKLLKTKKHIHFYGTTQNLAQVRLAGKLVKDLQRNQITGNTAIVLADENLLEPLLNSLPDEITNINITMGLSLKNTLTCNFYANIFEFLKNVKISKGNFEFYFQDVYTLLKSSILNSLKEWSICIEKAINFLRFKNYGYVAYTEIKIFFIECKPLDQLLSDLFSIKKRITKIDIADQLIEIHNSIIESILPFLQSQIEKNAIFTYRELFQKLLKYNQLNDLLKNEKVFIQILKQLEITQKINFLGEPLEGLQIMGMLETRALDFDNIILLSANEGVLPKSGSENSLIPNELKKMHGLSGYKERDSIYAYYFYRLLQHPSQTFIIYNTEADSFGTGEESRFIQQLRMEAQLKNNQIELYEKNFEIPIIFDPLKNPIIEKDEVVQAKLKALFDKGLSPSALNTFINCPLDFYYKYVLGIKDPEEMEISIDASRMGSIIHKVLEELYKSMQEKDSYDAEEISKVSTKVEALLKKYYEEKNSIAFGKNHLIFNVSASFIQSFLEQEKKILLQAKKIGIEPKILFIEKKLESIIDVEIENSKIPVKITGNADRIDLWGNITRIIDYKTGSVNNKHLDAANFEKLASNIDYSKALQLYAYAYMFIKTTGVNQVQSSIFSFKSPTKGYMSLEIEKDNFIITESHLQMFENIFVDIVQKIWRADHPFEHNKKSKYCKLCQ